MEEQTPRKIAFVFPGQGSQVVGMGKEMAQAVSSVRELFEMADDITHIHVSRLCFEGPIDKLTETVHLQPCLSVVNLACLDILRQYGIKPWVCAGHSLGEYSGLTASGVLSVADCLNLVFRRGQLMHREAVRNRGSMHAVVGLSLTEVQSMVDTVREDGGIVSVANYNTELQIVITGTPDSVEAVSRLASQSGARAVPLKVSGAWHSELIRGAEPEFAGILRQTEFLDPTSDIVLNVTADYGGTGSEIREVMARQLCSPVQWYPSMKRLVADGVNVFVEVGPGRVLSGLLKQILPRDYPCEIHQTGNLKQLEAVGSRLR